MYQNKVYQMVFQIVRHDADARDIVQDAFVKAYQSLDKYDRRFRFITWVSRIAVNLSLNLIKKRKRQPVSLQSVPEPAALEKADTDALPRIPKEKILAAAEMLRPAYRIAFTLFHVEGYRYSEVASLMDVKIGSVKNYLFRARKKLLKILTPETFAP
ncbi:MAG TPA: RNA polymerase sigma factor [Phycisphaerae bacterium]|nr:RNA polymerase sigma factor [Phycisphaerae bacterium]